MSYQIGLLCQKIVHLNAKFRFDRKVCNHLSQFATNESCMEVMYVKHCIASVVSFTRSSIALGEHPFLILTFNAPDSMC